MEFLYCFRRKQSVHVKQHALYSECSFLKERFPIPRRQHGQPIAGSSKQAQLLFIDVFLIHSLRSSNLSSKFFSPKHGQSYLSLIAFCQVKNVVHKYQTSPTRSCEGNIMLYTRNFIPFHTRNFTPFRYVAAV